MKFFISIIIWSALGSTVQALSFKEAMKRIESHRKIKEIEQRTSALTEESKSRGSWGDPTLKFMAKNYPKDSLDPEQSPMSGQDIVLTQRIPLSNKYGDRELEFQSLAVTSYWLSKQKVEQLRRALWIQIIKLKSLLEERQILSENLQWLDKIIKISQKLYSTGKKNQQAVLELKIRKSEVKSLLQSNKTVEGEVLESIRYLVNENSPIKLSTVPWKVLTRRTDAADLTEKRLISLAKAKTYAQSFHGKSFIPDLNISLAYTKRSNLDGLGDFVSIGAAIELPISGKKYAEYSKAKHEQQQSQTALEDYKRYRKSELKKLKIMTKKLSDELDLLSKETISFAELSRKVTTKSYQLGEASYTSLLQSELKLQSLRMKKISLKEKLRETQLAEKVLLGEQLYE